MDLLRHHWGAGWLLGALGTRMVRATLRAMASGGGNEDKVGGGRKGVDNQVRKFKTRKL